MSAAILLWQWWVFVVAVGVLALVAAIALWFPNVDRNGDVSGPVAIVAFLAALLFLFIGGVISVGRHYNRVSCRTFAAQTNRETKFVVYNSWSMGDCLTPDGTGRWIPTKNLREFGNTS